MRRCWFPALLFVAGCGRFGFGDHAHATDAGGGDDDGTSDVGDGGGGMQQFAYFKASNTEAFDGFGWTLALSADGSTFAVSAPSEDGAIAGIDASDGSNNMLSQTGAVYVFVRAGMTWQQQAFIKASTISINDAFGTALAISADGNTLAVGAALEDSVARGINGNEADDSAADSGAVYMFVRGGTTWSQQAYMKSSNSDAGDQFGSSVALSASGDVLAVGAVAEDSAATGINGNSTDNTQSNSGAAYVFTRAGTAWTEQAYIKAWNSGSGDSFGESIALSTDGATLAVGAEGEDCSVAGVQQGTLACDNATAEAGAAYVFTKSAVWTQQAFIKPTFVGFGGDFFSHAMALSGDGNVLVCGSPGEDTVANSGAAWVFRRAGTTWVEQTKLKASNPGNNDQFGAAVAISGIGNDILIGSPFEDSNASGFDGDQGNDASSDSGAVYSYAFTTGVGWNQVTYAKAFHPDQGDQFGTWLALSYDGQTLATSALYEDSAARGVDGDATNNGAQDSGCAGIAFH